MKEKVVKLSKDERNEEETTCAVGMPNEGQGCRISYMNSPYMNSKEPNHGRYFK